MDRQDYIEIILDHFENPRHKHRMEDADIHLAGGNPGCGDMVTVYLKVDDNNRIAESSFEGQGCTISQAGGSIITELVEGMTLDEVANLGTQTIIEEMGADVVKSRTRCATLALGTVQTAIAEYLREKSRNDLAARLEASAALSSAS